MQFNYNLIFYYLQLFSNSLNFTLLINYRRINKFINSTIINCRKFTIIKNDQLKKKVKILFILNSTENLNINKN